MRRITVDEQCLDPAEILKRLNSIVKTSLQQDSEYVNSDDGLDASICFVNTQEKKLIYAGARLPLTYIYNGSIQTLKSDRQSIGYRKSDLDFEFTNHPINIEDGMMFYLYTDGIVDQLGGERHFSFGKQKLNNLLIEIHNSPFDEQKNRIIKSFDEYKGKKETMDDVTVIGFKVKD